MSAYKIQVWHLKINKNTIVTIFAMNLHNRNHHFYFDNFFSSLDLFLDLWRVRLYGCVTLLSNHKAFSNDLNPDLMKGFSNFGDCLVRQHNNVTVSLWQDNHPVVVISSIYNPTHVTSVEWKSKDGTSNPITCPQTVYSYNTIMGRIDRNDQLCQYYSVHLKGRKNYKYHWWFLFDVTVTNAYVL